MPNPFAPRVRRSSPPEVLSELDQFVIRLRLLGATDEELEAVRTTWDELDESWTAEDRTALTLLGDDELRAELLATRDEYQHDTTDETEQEQLDAAAFQEQVRLEAAAEITKSIPRVLEWVGEDVPRAIAIVELETSENGAGRKGIVEPLTALIAGPDTEGIPVQYAGEQPLEVEPDGTGDELPEVSDTEQTGDAIDGERTEVDELDGEDPPE